MSISQNGQTHSNNSSEICRRIVRVCLTILWYSCLKGQGSAIHKPRTDEHTQEHTDEHTEDFYKKQNKESI